MEHQVSEGVSMLTTGLSKLEENARMLYEEGKGRFTLRLSNTGMMLSGKGLKSVRQVLVVKDNF